MKLTNRANLPPALVAAVENDPYSKGDARYSVTGLLKPSRIVALESIHRDVLEEDAEDRLWSLYGQIAHVILERANRTAIAEKRFFGEIAGVKVSAQVDTLDLEGGLLSDWKFTTAWKFKRGQQPPADWVAQLNMQLELLRQNGLDATRLQIVGLLRDFSKLEAKRSGDYPQASVQVMSIPLWPREKTIAFMEGRIRSHDAALANLPLCSAEEKWEKPPVYALMKTGGKRAVRLFDNHADAVFAQEQNGKQYHVEFRPGQAIRCESFCSVASVCSQYQATLTNNQGESDESDVPPA